MSPTNALGLPLFPGWRYPPPTDGVAGEAKLFKTADEMPEGWSSHPMGEEAAAAAAHFESSVVTSEGLAKFPGWRLPPGAISAGQAVLFHSLNEVPEGWTEALVDPNVPPASAEPVKDAAPAPAPAPTSRKKAAPAPAPAPVVELTREAAVARLVAEFGYQPGDPDMAAASDAGVLAVLADEVKKRV